MNDKAEFKAQFKSLVHSTYDLQKLRIQCGNRITANFKAKLGQAPSMSEDTLDDVSKALLAKIRSSNKLVTTGAIKELEKQNEFNTDLDISEAEKKKAKKQAGLISDLLEHQYKTLVKDDMLMKEGKFTGNAVISNYTEMVLIQQYKEIEKQEAIQFTRFKFGLKEFPIYTEYLEKIHGIGPAMAGVIISEFDIEKANYASSFIKYAGLDVAEDGFGRSKRKAHQIDKEYIDAEGDVQTKKSITFNPFLKTKMVGVLADVFIRTKSPYAELYYDYKNRLENHPIHQVKSKAHKHRMALRRMIKIFLIDLWLEWRAIENLPVSEPYHVKKLGLSDHGKEKELISKYGRGYTNTAPKE